MERVLDKTSPVALPVQLKRILQQRIESAYYAPGRRIDSVRKISAEFKVSSLTVQRALKSLESDGFVVSVPANGIFVNERFAQEKKAVKIAFVFPEAAISRDKLYLECWALDSEIYRGLLAGAQQYGAKVDFIYVDKDSAPLSLMQQERQLRKFDAVVFVGAQLLELQLELARTMPVFQFSGLFTHAAPSLINVDYDQPAAVDSLTVHAAECGCRTAGVITAFDLAGTDSAAGGQELHRDFRVRAAHFIDSCHRHGLETPEQFQLEYDFPDSIDALKNVLDKGHPDFLFCNHTYHVVDLYEACAAAGLRIGKDIRIAAIASGVTFQGLLPALTYVQVPMFELAVGVVREICRMTAENIPAAGFVFEKLKAPLVVGKSTVDG